MDWIKIDPIWNIKIREADLESISNSFEAELNSSESENSNGVRSPITNVYHEAIQNAGNKMLVFAAGGSALGVVSNSIVLGGVGVAVGAILGLLIALREHEPGSSENAQDS